MEVYKNLDGNSAVVGFEIGSDSITVFFNDGAAYLYTYQSAGQDHIEQMKSLAQAGRGLNSYIMRYVRKNYASKTR